MMGPSLAGVVVGAECPELRTLIQSKAASLRLRRPSDPRGASLVSIHVYDVGCPHGV